MTRQNLLKFDSMFDSFLKRMQCCYDARYTFLSTTKTISTALIISRLYYCNSLLNNIAKRDLAKLKRVQNCVVCVVHTAPCFSPSLPLLRQLHWLPLTYRLKFILSTLTYLAFSTQQPPDLACLLHLSNTHRQVRSSISNLLFLKLSLTWANPLSLSLRQGSELNSPSL